MVDAKNAPQILEHLQKQLQHTCYDVKYAGGRGAARRGTGAHAAAPRPALTREPRGQTLPCRWVPSSARFVAVGSYPRDTGCLQVFELDGQELKLLKEEEKKVSFKCATFGHASLSHRTLATGDFHGNLAVWDLEKSVNPIWTTKAHVNIINAIDGFGGQTRGCGAPEIVTCGRDGRVCVWDPRQRDAPVAALEPETPDSARDCWSVAFGNAYNNDDRCVVAGYDNGDVKLFDLRVNAVRWETNVKNGVCSVSFDRQDIEMNKLSVCCLESRYHVFDMRTKHPQKGYASLTEGAVANSTVWGCDWLPQNREVCMVRSGDGGLSLYRYHYPDQRRLQDAEGLNYGVPGSLTLEANRQISTQPICSFNWSPDKEGLCVMASFDQCIRVGIVTKTNKV